MPETDTVSEKAWTAPASTDIKELPSLSDHVCVRANHGGHDEDGNYFWLVRYSNEKRWSEWTISPQAASLFAPGEVDLTALARLSPVHVSGADLTPLRNLTIVKASDRVPA